MTAKKSAAKKPAKKAEPTPEVTEEATAGPAVTEMEGPEYEAGFLGVSHDDEDYSVAAQVAKLAEQ